MDAPAPSYWEAVHRWTAGTDVRARYPGDFDGIIAGAPAYNQIYLRLAHASV